MDLRWEASSPSPLVWCYLSGFCMCPLPPWWNTFYSYFVEYFYHEWLLDFVRYFFCMCRDDHVLLFFISLVWCITLSDFCMSNQTCILGINPSWYVFRFGLLIFYWGYLHLYSQDIISMLCVCFPCCVFLCDVLVWFWCQSK